MPEARWGWQPGPDYGYWSGFKDGLGVASMVWFAVAGLSVAGLVLWGKA